MKYIALKHGNREALLRRFPCNKSTISNALNFKHRSLLQAEIRSYALNFLGGVYVNIRATEENRAGAGAEV